MLGASNEGKSGDTTANPPNGAEQRQPHITGAPAGRVPKSQLLQLKLWQNVKHFPWPRTDSEWNSKHSQIVLPTSTTGTLELKLSPKNIPAAALMHLESRRLGMQDPVCLHTCSEAPTKLQRAQELGEARGDGGAELPAVPLSVLAAAGLSGSHGVCRARERLVFVSSANETDTSCFSLNQSDHRAEPKLIHS